MPNCNDYFNAPVIELEMANPIYRGPKGDKGDTGETGP
jgi:hypothetical protein